MNSYHVLVEQDEGWYLGRVLERPGVNTQGRTLDELVFMVRDAIELLWNEKDAQLELVISSATRVAEKRANSRRRRRAA